MGTLENKKKQKHNVLLMSEPSYLKVFDNIDYLSGGIGVGDGALVSHGPQLSKGSN